MRHHLVVEDACGEAQRNIRARSDGRAVAVRAANAEREAGSPGVTCLHASSSACLPGHVQYAVILPSVAGLSCDQQCVEL